MPIRKKKIYNRPRKLYHSERIEEENQLLKKYGLKNKREVWKADFAVGKLRKRAKKLISSSEKERESFIERQKSKGFKVETIADILSLKIEDYLGRRLQSLVVKKGLATTPKQARQFITHKHISIKGNINNTPSHLTTLDEEKEIELNISLPAKNKKELTEEEKELLEKTKIKENNEEESEEDLEIEEEE